MNSQPVQRIALWCVPSQHPSPLLRAFTRGEGVAVSDEPLAATYLDYRRRFHGKSTAPSLDELGDWNAVVDELLSAPPVDDWEGDLNPPVAWVQKHMANQLLLHTKRDWLGDFRHVFVLRDPRGQLAAAKSDVGMVRLEDTCIPHQLAIYRWVLAHLEQPPLVLFEEDLLHSPQEVLMRLCDSLGLPFQAAMADQSQQRHEGDACWYPEGAEIAGPDESSLAEIKAQYPDLMWRCHHMQAEMMKHCVTATDSDTLVSWAAS